MGRPRVPLIDRDEAIAKALALIDHDGVDAFSIRRLGAELGVNGASLYHHFKDKEEILHGVRLLILAEARVLNMKKATWQDYVVTSVARYRTALLRHPNAAPLMVPGRVRQIGASARELIIEKMLATGVPVQLAYPIIDSAETLAFGSALLNPGQLSPRERWELRDRDDVPHLKRAVRSSARTAERLFRLELQALLDGWAALIDREHASAQRADASSATAVRGRRALNRRAPRPSGRG